MSKRIALLGGWLLLLLLPAVAWAHGGGDLQVAAEPAGPFAVSVWTNPPTALTNETVHLTVGVAQQGDGAPVLDAVVQVTVLAKSEATTAVLTVPATTEQSTNKLFYETDFVLPDSGTYTVVVAVRQAAGEGEVAFDLVVRPASNRWYGWLAAGVVALLAAWAIGQGVLAKGEAATAVNPARPLRRPRSKDG